MTKDEEIEVIGYAEHFDGDLKLAAAAHVLGLGFMKMKKRIPKNTHITQRAEINRIYKAITGVEKTTKPKP